MVNFFSTSLISEPWFVRAPLGAETPESWLPLRSWAEDSPAPAETTAAAATGCKGADVAEDVALVVLDAVQRRTTTPTTNKGVPVGVAVRNLDVGASRDGGARRNQKNGANMVADLSDNNPKSNGGAEKKKERTAGQFFHIGEQGEQGDASAKVGAELHPLDYSVLDTGAA
ncbi:unnamed protein product [Closterium sp. NIES-54]